MNKRIYQIFKSQNFFYCIVKLCTEKFLLMCSLLTVTLVTYYFCDAGKL